MVEVQCQRCGAKHTDNNVLQAHLKIKHEKGCGSGIGIVKVISQVTPTAHPKADEQPKVDETSEPEEKPKSKKSSKRKKKSDD